MLLNNSLAGVEVLEPDGGGFDGNMHKVYASRTPKSNILTKAKASAALGQNSRYGRSPKPDATTNSKSAAPRNQEALNLRKMSAGVTDLSIQYEEDGDDVKGLDFNDSEHHGGM